MPIYAYRCESCGHAKDVLQKMSDPVLTVCPACGADSFRKQLTAAGFQLKGSGWYVTDFKGGSTSVPPVKTDDAAPPAKSADGDKGAAAPAAASGSDSSASKAPAASAPAAAPAPAPKSPTQGSE
jgi:putative FmdB family regulatory protein